MKLINDWLMAIAICKKYNIKWNPFHHLNNAECLYRFGRGISVVIINPFYPKFIDSFVHEIGHLRRWEKIHQATLGTDDTRRLMFDQNTSCILKEEYMAWKYSKRFLKSRFDKTRAKNMFRTYYNSSAKQVTPLVATDRYYVFDRNI